MSVVVDGEEVHGVSTFVVESGALVLVNEFGERVVAKKDWRWARVSTEPEKGRQLTFDFMDEE